MRQLYAFAIRGSSFFVRVAYSTLGLGIEATLAIAALLYLNPGLFPSPAAVIALHIMTTVSMWIALKQDSRPFFYLFRTFFLYFLLLHPERGIAPAGDLHFRLAWSGVVVLLLVLDLLLMFYLERREV